MTGKSSMWCSSVLWHRQMVYLAVLAVIVLAAPTGAAGAWSVSLPKEGDGALTVAPDTTVLAGSCTDVTHNGGVLWQLPEVLGRTPNCMDAVTDSEGNTYVLTEESATANPVIESLNSSGTVRWAVPTGGFVAFRTGPVLGANGSVFFSMWNGGSIKLVGYDEQTGAITLQQMFEDVTGLHAYAGGLMVVNTDSEVIYLGYDGTVLAKYSTGPSISAYEAYSNAGAEGTLFVAGYNGGCGTDSHASVEKFTPAGLAWTWTDKATYCSQTSLAATPDGGVVFARSVTNPSADFTSLSATGAERWTDDMQGPIGPAQGAGYFPVRVDVNGVVALPAKMLYRCSVQPSEECSGAQVELVSAQTGTTVFDPVQLQGQGEHGFDLFSDAIGAERLYITGEIGELSATPTLNAFAIPGLGLDYQLALQETLTTKPNSPPPSGGGGGSSGGASGSGPGSPPVSGCAAYMVIDSRGSGERSGTISPPGKAFAAEFQKLHRAARVTTLANPYPAVGLWGSWRDVLNLIGAKLGIGPLGAYHDSVVDGKKWLQNNIASEISACPGTKLLLTGYSQGAQVTGDVYQRDVSITERRHLIAVVLFGDPYFDPADTANDRGNFAHDGRGGVLGTRRSFGGDSRVLSYCHLHDPICQHPTTIGLLKHRLKQHENYPPDAVAAAKHF